MIGAGRIPDARHARLVREEIRQCRRGPATGLHAKAQCFDAFQQDPGVEGRHRRTGVTDERLQHVIHPFRSAEDRAAKHASLPVDMFGAGIHDDIRAHGQRLLQQRSSEHIVDHHDCPGLMRQIGDRAQIGDFQHRIGRRFQQHQRRGLVQSVAPLRQIAAIDEDRLNAEFRQQRGDDPVTGAKQRAGRDDTVSRLQMRQQGRVDRSHPGRGRAAGLRALDQAHALFQHRQRRIGETRILIVRDRAVECRFRLLGIFINEAGGQIECLGGFAMRAAIDPALHEAGRGTEF